MCTLYPVHRPRLVNCRCMVSMDFLIFYPRVVTTTLHSLTWGIWISCLMCRLGPPVDVIAELGYWPSVTASPDIMVNWWWLVTAVVTDVTTPPRNVCTAIWRCRIIWSFLARSRLYMGPNLFRPPRILSARTAETQTKQRLGGWFWWSRKKHAVKNNFYAESSGVLAGPRKRGKRDRSWSSLKIFF